MPDGVACPGDDSGDAFVSIVHGARSAGRAGELALLGLDAATGAVRWRVPFPAGATRGDDAACAVGNTVVGLFARGAAVGYDRRDARPVGEVASLHAPGRRRIPEDWREGRGGRPAVGRRAWSGQPHQQIPVPLGDHRSRQFAPGQRGI